MQELDFKRADRVGQLLQQELGRLLVNGINDPRVGFCTVTEVRLTKDLRSARVFVSVYGDETQRRNTLEGLQSCAGFLKRELGKVVRLRYTPQLQFEVDTTLDKAQRLDTVLAAIDAGEAEAPDGIGPAAVPVHTERSVRADAARTLDDLSPKPPKKPRRRRNKRR